MRHTYRLVVRQELAGLRIQDLGLEGLVDAAGEEGRHGSSAQGSGSEVGVGVRMPDWICESQVLGPKATSIVGPLSR